VKKEHKVIYRRYVGLILGAGLGFVYGIVSQSINRIFLPDIPLYQPPLGLPGNIILWTFIGALLGLVAALPDETIVGALYGGVTGATLLTLFTLSTGRIEQDTLATMIISVLFLFVPMVGAITPLVAIQRWVVNKLVEAHLESEPPWVYLPLPILLLALVGAIGASSLMPPYARVMLTRTEKILQTGLSSAQVSQLPKPLQQERVGGFLDNATNRYRLEWRNRDITRFAIPRPMSNRPWEESAVIARFNNGWILVCLYAKSDAEPACKGFPNGL
jgi:hypothetical protein